MGSIAAIIDELIIIEIIIIICLFLLLVMHKSTLIRRNKKMQKHKKFLAPYMNEIITCFDTNAPIDKKTYNVIKKKLKNKQCYEIITTDLINYLAKKDYKNKKQAIEFCEQLTLVEIEIKRLKTNDVFEKMYAVKRIGEYKSNAAVECLCAEFYTLKANDNSSLLEYHILLSLSKIGNIEAFMEIVDKVNFESIISFNALIETIDQFSGKKKELYSKLIKLNLENLIRATILSAGMKKFHHIADDVVRFCKHDNMELRIAAIKFLGEAGNPKYCSDVANLLDDNHWEVQAIAAKSLGNLSPGVFENKKLITSLKQEQWYVKSNAVASLLLTKDGVKMLAHFLCDQALKMTLKQEIASIVIDHITNLQALKIDVQKGKFPERKRSYKFLQLKDSKYIELLTNIAVRIINE